MIVALIVGTILSLAAFAFVLTPVVVGVKRRSIPRALSPTSLAADLPIVALREIEFDRATGKLSDADYARLRERYANEALTAMRGSARQAPATFDDPIEAAVRAYRDAHPTCPTCGIRPESDAIYCSNCGGFLPGTCGSCGTAVTASGVRYCIVCGHKLAA
jgi:hypothetical protein